MPPSTLLPLSLFLHCLQSIESWEREQELYKELVLTYLHLEDVVKNQQRPGEPFASSTHGPLPVWLAHAEWWWFCRLRRPAFR